MSLYNKIQERINLFFTGKSEPDDKETSGEFFTRQKIIAFVVSFTFALSLWLIVNLGRDYNVTLMLPIEITNLPDDVALSNEVPERAAVSLSGEGWNLISLYSNPPAITLNADDQQINLFDQVRQQVGTISDLNVLQVDPIIVGIETEQKVTRKIPLRSQVSLSFREQYGLIGDYSLSPDSITISGPISQIEEIDEWRTNDVELTDISNNVNMDVNLEVAGPGISIEPLSAQFQARVAEFTESQVRIPIRTRNLPSGKAITYTPSSITVRFDVPIDQYNDIQGTRPYLAYVDYTEIEEDETGLITPEIELATDEFDVRLRNFQPTRVSYYNILPQ